MKNKNLNEAFRMLDKENLKHSENVPAEELYYSSAYEKHIARLFEEKKGFSWKVFGKRAVTFALGAAFAIGILAVIPKPQTPEIPPVQTNETTSQTSENTDFVDDKTNLNANELANLIEQLGHTVGTYEYEYMQILSEISYYTGIANHYIENAEYHKENELYKENSKIGGFLKCVDIDEFTAPYGDILRYSKELLTVCGFTPASMSMDDMREYWFSLPYVKSRESIIACTGLSFANVHEKLTEYAEKLLALEEKYPDYEGELLISSYISDMAEKLIEACKPVYENKTKHLLAWLAYYEETEPKMIVNEEFVPELDAVKITITGEGRYAAYALPARYIDNYQYETFDLDNYRHKQQVPTQTFSIYLPIHVYTKENRLKTIEISKYHADDTIYEEPYKEIYTLTLDPMEYYSDEPITLENDALDAALRKQFGGDYSERDLLYISTVMVQALPKPSLVFDFYKDGEHIGFGVKMEKTDTLAAELEHDLRYFHGFSDVGRSRYGDTESILSEALAEELRPYTANPNIATRTPLN